MYHLPPLPTDHLSVPLESLLLVFVLVKAVLVTPGAVSLGKCERLNLFVCGSKEGARKAAGPDKEKG